MLDAALPAVQVTVIGVDWPAVVAAIVTGVAAVAGIGGTAWQAWRGRQAQAVALEQSLSSATQDLLTGIGAEDRRAERLDRRSTYAAYQSSLDRFIVAAEALRSYGEDPEHGRRADLISELASSFVAMRNGLGTLRLIAPKDLGAQAEEAAQILSRYSSAVENGKTPADSSAQFLELREGLYRAMRADLAEPVTPARDHGPGHDQPP